MTFVQLLGWTLVQSLWQVTLLTGVAIFGLAIVRRPETRDVLARAVLAAMVVLPVVTAAGGFDVLAGIPRRPLLMGVDRVVPLPEFLKWRTALLPAVGLLWAAGLTVGLIRVAAGWRRTRLLRTLPARCSPEIDRLAADICLRLGIRTPVDVRETACADVPFVLGWRSSSIFLPARSTEVLDPSQLRGILAHELTHVRRRDFAMNVCQLVAESVLFHHPGARYVGRRIRLEREYCCDDVAVDVCGSRAAYARALATLENGRRLPAPVLAAASGTLVDRVQRIAGVPCRVLTRRRAAAALAAACLASALLAAATLALPPSMPSNTRLRTRRPPQAVAVPVEGVTRRAER